MLLFLVEGQRSDPVNLNQTLGAKTTIASRLTRETTPPCAADRGYAMEHGVTPEASHLRPYLQQVKQKIADKVRKAHYM